MNYDVVIIDSGVTLGDSQEVDGISIKITENGSEYSNDINDRIGHGTVIYSVIKNRVKNAKVFVVKIDGGQEFTEGEALVDALKFIKKNISCKIINISLGIVVDEGIPELKQLCSEIIRSGTVIVSAFDNEGCISYPAAYDCVIGVDSKDDFANAGEFDFVEKGPINVFAKGGIQRVSIAGKTLLTGGSSVACAHITAILLLHFIDIIDYEKAVDFLRKGARNRYSFKYDEEIDNKLLWEIHSAAVFPFSKETQAFLRFEDMVSFKIQGYYDIRQSGKVGRSLSSFYKRESENDIIMDIDSLCWDEIDTIILGHLDKLNVLIKRDLREEIIRIAINRRVNIYSFDPLDKYAEILKESNVSFFCSQITSEMVRNYSFGKLYKISKPVVGIFGTSSKQGKFSLQLGLKRSLTKMGYDVGTVGTEPHVQLFGFDVGFPMGYNSTVGISNQDIVLYINHRIKKLCEDGKEIIIGASQAQTVPFYCNNILEYPVMQYHFALGLNPDAVILCINYYDEKEYIKNTIDAIGGLTNSTVIALVMYPLTFVNEWSDVKRQISSDEFCERASLLQEKFKIPVFLLSDQDVDKLCQSVINYF